MKIPSRPEDLTTVWLTRALRRDRSIREASVVSFEAGPLEEGTGFFGQLSRLRLEYDANEDTAPRSLILKLSSAEPAMRSRPNTIVAYRNEVRFYQRLADRTSLRTPKCHYADIDPRTGLHILLLEDLAPARSGSALTGCSLEHAELAIREIAHFHATWWESPSLAELDFLVDLEPDPAAFSAAHDEWWPVFLEKAGHALPKAAKEIGQRLRESTAWITSELTRKSPRTLQHSDYKLENLVFASEAGGVPFAVIDWQLMRRGRGVWDVAYFLTQSLLPEMRRANEMHLLKTYHRTLEADGVSGYAFDQCLHDYRLSLLRRFGALVSTIAAMPFSEEQIRLHIDVFLQRNLAAIRDHDAGALLR